MPNFVTHAPPSEREEQRHLNGRRQMFQSERLGSQHDGCCVGLCNMGCVATGLQHESRCNRVGNKDHVAKRDVQMRGTMARWEVHWTARDLADLCPSRPMRSVSKLTSMQVNCTFLLFAKDVKI